MEERYSSVSPLRASFHSETFLGGVKCQARDEKHRKKKKPNSAHKVLAKCGVMLLRACELPYVVYVVDQRTS